MQIVYGLSNHIFMLALEINVFHMVVTINEKIFTCDSSSFAS